MQPDEDISLMNKKYSVSVSEICDHLKGKHCFCRLPFGTSKMFLTECVGFVVKGVFPSNKPLVYQCLMLEIVAS